MSRIALHRGFLTAVTLAAAATTGVWAQEKPKEPGKTLRGHAETVYQVAFSPDGTMLATASFDNTIKLWRVGDAVEVGTLTGHTGKVLAIAFSSDGRSLLSGSEDKSIKLWNVPTGGPGKLSGHSGGLRALVLSPDGKWLVSASDDKTVRVWNRGAGKEELKIEGLAAPVLSLAVSADSTLLAGGSEDQKVFIWTLPVPPPPPPAAAGGQDLVAAGANWRFQKGNAAAPGDWTKPGFDDSKWTAGDSGFGYSSSAEELSTVKTKLDDMMGAYVSVFIRKTFKVADPKAVEKLTLKVLSDDGFVAYLNGAEVGRANVEGSPPGHDQAAASSVEATEATLDLTPHIAKLVAGDNVLAIQGHNSSAPSSDFVLTPVLSAALKAPDAPPPPPAPKAGAEVKSIAGLGGAVSAVAFSPNGKQVAAALASGEVRVHSIPDGAEAAKLPGHAGGARGVAFVDDATLASAGADKTIRIWSVAEKKEVRALAGHEGPVTSLAIRADRKMLASGSEDKSLRLWDPANPKELKSIAGHEGPVLAVSFAASGKEAATGCADGKVRVFNVEDGKQAASFNDSGEVRAVAISPDARYYSGGAAPDIVDWRVVSQAAVRTFTGHGDIVHSVGFSPDGQQIASGSADKTVRTWTLADGKQIRAINAHGASVYCVAYSTDGKQIASGGFDKLVKIWNAADGAEVKKLEGHEEGVFCLAFLDPNTVFSGSSDRTIRKWDIKEGKAVQVLVGHPGWVSDIRLVPGKPRAVSVDYGGNLMVWDLEKGQSIFTQKLPAIVHGLALSADTKWMATANGDSSSFLFESPQALR